MSSNMSRIRSGPASNELPRPGPAAPALQQRHDQQQGPSDWHVPSSPFEALGPTRLDVVPKENGGRAETRVTPVQFLDNSKRSIEPTAARCIGQVQAAAGLLLQVVKMQLPAGVPLR